MKNYNHLNPLVGDIQRQYTKHRTSGKSRDTAIAIIQESYPDELQDIDDRVAVMIALALSLGKKRELTEDIAEETICAIQQVEQMGALDEKVVVSFQEMKRYLADKSLYGEEATYKLRKPYVPDWQVGDTFSHVLTYPASEPLGISGWSILFYKAGEHFDEFGECRQLMYVTLCPPGKEPLSGQELQELGFLRMMCHGKKWDYLSQITIKSAKAELSYGLKKIGNFTNIKLPQDRTDENPLTTMPLFGRGKGDPWPGFEDQICRFYKKFGSEAFGSV